ncbi:Glutamate--cysteine ligase [Oligella urethralis]|uniref:glutamate--cysteine ligase n=1 Tax=Oligella urethralis TaxID=90245 RepID=UPI000E008065|nr:glutamate--cysteine ligase [Oligella urethralis]SUA64091.1 Glutamate--cysteine ligase [Oligella urethralis]
MSKFTIIKAQQDLLKQISRGIEREALRIDAHGDYALDSHPQALGATLTHPHITTDYSEALMELVTKPFHDVESLFRSLEHIHGFVLQNIGEQSLWMQSIPCELPPEELIPIAWYGHSNEGMLKHVYRRGLAERYGKAMQCIAGIHYNFSLPEAIWQHLEPSIEDAKERQSVGYMSLIRNFKRQSWLLMYLFGASPIINRSFVGQAPHQLLDFDDSSLYLPYATSLRMSDLGYTSEAQANIRTCYNRIESYVSLIYNAVTRPWPAYEKIGTHRDGEWIQLNTNMLQIENEYYAGIRPKRTTKPGERPNNALIKRGVQYVEVRCMDVDPFEPTGISSQSAYFLDTFLLYCAVSHSPRFDAEDDCDETDNNFKQVVTEGRKPGLTLQRHGQPITLKAWGLEIIEALAPYAELLDKVYQTTAHRQALAAQQAKLEDIALTPAARYQQAVRDSGLSFNEFTKQNSLQHSDRLRALKLPAEVKQALVAESEASLQSYLAKEKSDTMSFDDYLRDFETGLVDPEAAS